MEFKMQFEGDNSDAGDNGGLNEPMEAEQEEEKDRGMVNDFGSFMDDDPVIITNSNINLNEKKGDTSFITDRRSINIFMLISAALLLLSIFLPYMSMKIQDTILDPLTQALTQEVVEERFTIETIPLLIVSPLYGIALALCSIAQIVMACLKQNRVMKILSVVVLVFVIRLAFRFLTANSMSYAVVDIKPLAGFWLMIISGIAMLISAFYRDFCGKVNVNED